MLTISGKWFCFERKKNRFPCSRNDRVVWNAKIMLFSRQNTVWNFLEENHLFARTHDEQTLDQTREITVRRINQIIEKEFVSLADVSPNKIA